MMERQIYLYYRTYWGKDSETGWLGNNVIANNKMEMVKTCISSMELSGLNVEKIAFVDNSIKEYSDFLKLHFDEVIETKEGHDCRDSINGWPIIQQTGSLHIMMQYMMDKKHNYDDIILVVEDDYLFAPNAINKWIRAIDELGGFVSPFDHIDRYIRNDDKYAYKTEIHIIDNHHWRQSESTTSTFGGEFQTFKKTYFLRFIPRIRIRGLFIDRLFGRELPGMDRIFMRRAYYWLRVKLHTPIPGLACHLSKYVSPDKKHFHKNIVNPKTHLSPGYDWEKRYSEVLRGQIFNAM